MNSTFPNMAIPLLTRVVLPWLPVCLLTVSQSMLGATDDVLYTTKVAPLLKEKCVACHGPVRQEAGLRLDAATLIRKGADSGTVIDLAEPNKSKILQRVDSQTKDTRMPPEGEGVPLKPEQIEFLRNWIAQGAEVPANEQVIRGPADHWAFRPLDLSRAQRMTSQKLIDEPIQRKQRELGVTPLSPADSPTWLRRVTLDLTGLPPSIDELEAFASNESDESISKIVNELLSRPAYGERWARHWMDVWRYSDWDGYKEELRGSQRNIWHWRDWIVESLNANRPYDQMILEMLAADEIYPTSNEKLRATGFLARNFHRSNRNIWLDATVEHTAKAFLGLTVNCAKCHDHKYDPITQEDYYRFRALFEPHHVRTDPVAVAVAPELHAFPRAYDSDLKIETHLFVRGDEKFPVKDKPLPAGIPTALPIPSSFEIQAVQLPLESCYPELTEDARRFAIQTAWKRVDTAKANLDREVQRAKELDLERDVLLKSSHANADSNEMSLSILKLQEAQLALESLRYRLSADFAKFIEQNTSRFEQISGLALLAEQRWKETEAQLKVEIAKQSLATAEQSEIKDESKKKASIDKAKKELATATDNFTKTTAKDGVGRLKSYTATVKDYPRSSTGRRTALAKWIIDTKNPLTARVAVNHIWARHFGTPLVDNVFDFGMKTPMPALIDVLDGLASELIVSGWDMKHMHRLIVLSETYQRASSGDASVIAFNKSKDPDNRLLWRFDVRRLDAEEVRDSMLFASQTIDARLGGPDIDEEQGEKIFRRSLYFRHAYEKQMTMMVMFDAASPTECYRRRPSIIPQQALVLANSPLARMASRKIGTQMWNSFQSDSAIAIQWLFMKILGRNPSASELKECVTYLELNGLTEKTMQSLAHVMINHNDFVSAR